MEIAAAARELRILFDARFYLTENPDVQATGMDPVEHYLRYGADEGRQPCPLFDGAWYRTRYADVAASGLNPLLHYIRHGGMEMRDPNPRFNAAFYVDAHPECIGNPLLYHLLHGAALGWPTEPPVSVEDLLPSRHPVRPLPAAVNVDVVIPVYRGLAQTQRCLESVLADPVRPPGRILVIDDASPEPRISRWLDGLARRGQITLLRNARNLGFVRSVNRGIDAARPHDVVLLNSDTEVPPGWLARLARAAYAAGDIATVSPFSNNATICSYPVAGGGELPQGVSVAEIDAACQAANAGRIVDLPTTVGFCMYIRRAALARVGLFDARAFGHGYGEEVDFCRRASADGWRHVLACDVFVYHEGEVSFGADSPHARKGQAALRKRHPDYEADVQRHARLDPAQPSRFALTAALFRQSGLPGILFVAHNQGGGVRRQMLEMVAALRGKANVLLLQPDARGIGLSVPAMPGHPVLSLAAERVDDLVAYLLSANIRRVHIHHVMAMTLDLRALVAELAVPFDLTLHDYFALCPQVNLLPVLDGQYCGEPDTRHCNACIAATPSHGASDIDSWRWRHAWMLRDAARVICPSADARNRLARHGLAGSAIVVPHETTAPATHPAPARRPGAKEPLRVALLGVLADRKGLATVADLADTLEDTADDSVALHLIGHPELPLPPRLAARLAVGGAYDEAELPGRIAQLAPHVFWFPAQWPETYSYTLSAALAAGGAIVATDIGAFTERLKDRPLTWLLPAGAPARDWLAAFAAARKALAARGPKPAALSARVADFYAGAYLRPLTAPPPRPAGARRKPAARRVLVLPELLETGAPAPCAHIRLLHPLHHEAIGAGCEIRSGDVLSVLREPAETVITHRLALTDPTAVAALVAHCRAQGTRLIYDLDDDLPGLPDDHPDAGRLRPLLPAAQALMQAADTIWVSTETLATRLGRLGRKAVVIPNGLEERLFWPPGAADRPLNGPLRLLYMGTGTHGADLELILPALHRLRETFGDRVAVDIIGITPSDLPEGLHRVSPPYLATRSYPAFVNWLSLQNRWHAGLAPLADTHFNRGKSAIKAMDYAALGLPTVASAIGVYEAAINDGVNGLLVPNRPQDWFAALSGLVRDPGRRQRMALAARETFTRRFTLAAQATTRRRALLGS